MWSIDSVSQRARLTGIDNTIPYMIMNVPKPMAVVSKREIRSDKLDYLKKENQVTQTGPSLHTNFLVPGPSAVRDNLLVLNSKLHEL